MAIVEHPLRFLILALFLLIGLLIFFKVSDFLRNLSEKNKKKKESKPVEKKCPNCNKYMVQKGNKIACSDEKCGYIE